MKIMRKMMWFFIACCILKANQAVAGDLYPEQAAAGLWHVVDPSSLSLNDQPDNTTTLNRSYRSTEKDGKDIEFFKKEIVERYGFKKNEDNNMWVEQGKFGDKGIGLGTKDFQDAADRALKFFKRNRDWSVTKSNPDFKKTKKCLELLYITAARYLLVTDILWKLQKKRDERNDLIQCETDGETTNIPASVCYPAPYGSATCTSDYDVGLVGKDSGFLTVKFNEYFKNTQEELERPSEKVFDTNVYAFTLEYAMPSKFSGLPQNFTKSVAENEEKVYFKMQELVSAYYKVFKYNERYFNQLCHTAKNTLSEGVTYNFKKWDDMFRKLHEQTSLKGEDIRLKHNEKYQKFVETISEKGYNEIKFNLERLAKALLYAAEAYHTRGAIRHVVGWTQMELEEYRPDNLQMMDLWVSMIENWGESIKEYNHCFDGNNKPVILEVCVLKMSKYMWRMLSAMCNLRQQIKEYLAEKHPKNAVEVERLMKKLVCFCGFESPENLMRYWLEEYKKEGSYQISSYQKYVSKFFESFDCPGVTIGNPFPRECLDAINDKVDEYNKKLAEIFSEKHKRKIKK